MSGVAIFDRKGYLQQALRFHSEFLTEDSNILGARLLRAIIPRVWFSWLSKEYTLLQCFLRPYKWTYWTKISDNIYLGAIPLKNKNHIEKIAGLGVKVILSINEDYEFNDLPFLKPVQSKDWQKKNIRVLRISSPDLEPIESTKLAAAVSFLVHEVSLGNKVYVHCTAGRGRSATVVACSLAKINHCTFIEALKQVQKCRPQVILSGKQKETAKKYSDSLSVV